MQDEPPAGAAQDGAASKDLGMQSGRLPVSRQAGSALKLGGHVEEQQNALEVGFGGEEQLRRLCRSNMSRLRTEGWKLR